MSTVQHRQLSPHFATWESQCPCGCGFGLNPGDVYPPLLGPLEELRKAYGAPLNVNSWCRCVRWEKRKGRSGKSQHTKGKAVDIRCGDLKRLVRLAEKIPAFRDGGIGIYKTFVHVDVRGKRARW